MLYPIELWVLLATNNLQDGSGAGKWRFLATGNQITKSPGLNLYRTVRARRIVRRKHQPKSFQVVFPGRLGAALALQRAEDVRVARHNAGVHNIVGGDCPFVARRRVAFGGSAGFGRGAKPVIRPKFNQALMPFDGEVPLGKTVWLREIFP